MPGDPLQKVIAGQKVAFAARAHNAFIDAARDTADSRFDAATPSVAFGLQPGVILIVGSGAIPIERFSCVGFDNPLITPTDNLSQFQSRTTFLAVAPTDRHKQRFAILQGPLSDYFHVPASFTYGQIARAVVAGVTPAKVYVASGQEDWEYAHPVGEADNLSLLSSERRFSLRMDRTCGARVLWKESGTGLVWAVVRMPDPSCCVVFSGAKLSRGTIRTGFISPIEFSDIDYDTEVTNDEVGTGYVANTSPFSALYVREAGWYRIGVDIQLFVKVGTAHQTITLDIGPAWTPGTPGQVAGGSGITFGGSTIWNHVGGTGHTVLFATVHLRVETPPIYVSQSGAGYSAYITSQAGGTDGIQDVRWAQFWIERVGCNSEDYYSYASGGTTEIGDPADPPDTVPGVGDDDFTGGTGSGGGVTIPCCGNEAPLTLTANLANVSGCSCVSAIVMTLTYYPANGFWYGSYAACGGTLKLYVLPCPTTTQEFVILFGIGDVFGSNTASTVTCSPFYLQTTITMPPNLPTCGQIQIDLFD